MGYLVMITIEMVYAKHVTQSVKLSTWGLMLYQNVIGTVMWPVVAIFSGEAYQIFQLRDAMLDSGAVAEGESASAAADTTLSGWTGAPTLMGVMVPVLTTCV